MAREVEEAFAGVQLRLFVDGTCGVGGHSKLIAKSHAELERLIALDKDASALQLARENLGEFGALVTFVHSDFCAMQKRLEEMGIASVSGVLLDLGVSSIQLDRAERGFSFQRDGPLDMRMNSESETSAADIVNNWSEEELAELFRFGEEPFAKRCARVICERRCIEPFLRTRDLSEVVEKVAFRNRRIHPATRIFQALRIEVNGELDALRSVLEQVAELLEPKGRAAIISFHSLEDRIVKHFIKERARRRAYGEVRDVDIIEISRKPITPSLEEINRNPRSRSAKLRVFEKI